MIELLHRVTPWPLHQWQVESLIGPYRDQRLELLVLPMIPQPRWTDTPCWVGPGRWRGEGEEHACYLGQPGDIVLGLEEWIYYSDGGYTPGVGASEPALFYRADGDMEEQVLSFNMSYSAELVEWGHATDMALEDARLTLEIGANTRPRPLRHLNYQDAALAGVDYNHLLTADFVETQALPAAFRERWELDYPSYPWDTSWAWFVAVTPTIKTNYTRY